MIVVTGHLVVDPADRDRVLVLSLPSVREARRHPACLDFAVAPDPVAAVTAKDLDAIAETLAEDVESFNMLPPHRITGRDVVLEGTRAWFDGYPASIGYEVHDLHVSADGDAGFCTYVYRVTGTLAGGDDVDMWVRATLGCERRDGTLGRHPRPRVHAVAPADRPGSPQAKLRPNARSARHRGLRRCRLRC